MVLISPVRATYSRTNTYLTREDARENYAEPRFQTAGWLDGRIVMLVWTPRGEARRIISMRKANEREIKEIGLALG